MTVPVIAIDGPAASGKGTIAQRAADALGWHYLDSGALYRLAALAALRAKVSFDDPAALTAAAQSLAPQFKDGRIWLDGEDVSEAIRAETVGVAASKCAAVPGVRQALFDLQRRAGGGPRRAVGAGGRDVGGVFFPEAKLKIFMTASARVRAERRVKQLEARGEKADLAALTRDLEERDRRDRERAVAPLKPAADARLLDTSEMGIDEVVKKVLGWWAELN